MRIRRALVRSIYGVLMATLAACGGSKTPTTPTDNTPPVVTNTITITAAGVSPKSVQITAGSRVLFVNNDSRTHDMASNPHPEHTDCPEINQIGFLSAGQQRETGNLNTIRTCGFHDHDNPFSTSLQGSIVIR